MSNLKTANGDDYPDAATKHLEDAKVLIGAQRFDGGAYLCGYVVECSLKTMIQFEGAAVNHTHKIPTLAQHIGGLASLAGAKTARYYTRVVAVLQNAAIVGWNPVQRYRSPEIDEASAKQWLAEASAMYKETLMEMSLNGDI